MELLKAIAHAVAVQQGANFGMKLVNDRRVTERDMGGLLLSLLFWGLVNAPAQQPASDMLARR
ncbi:MAG TPA: hypothetical protein VGC87_00100 [Pyrinomonadaceae bacterium]|jgi:hypothetical protein